MKIRRFFAPDIRQAMRLVREAQGPDAVILSNRNVEGGVEIVAAVDFDESMLSAAAHEVANETPAAAAPAPATRAAAQIGMFRAIAQNNAPTISATPAPAAPVIASKSPMLRSVPTTNKPAAAVPNSASAPAPAPIANHSKLTATEQAPSAIKPKNNKLALKPTAALKPANLTSVTTPTVPGRIPSYNPPEARIPAGSTWSENGSELENQDASQTSDDARRPAPKATDNLWGQDPVLVDMRRELKELRGLLEHQLSGLVWSETTRRTPVQAQLLRALSELGLTMNLSRELTGAVSAVSEFDTAWRHAMGLLAERLTVEEDAILEQGGIVALVGATGVGKTTTVAKLAAHYALRHGRERVALVTTDSYRIGSQEQLRTFARILGVPMRVAADADELAQTLDGLADCGLVLIDTAGMSQRDQRLAEQFTTLRGGSAERNIRTYLVLSAITQRVGLEEIIRAFSEMPLAGCILTKLDEAASLGEIISVVVRHQLPVTYLGVGQRVPEDLLPARAHNLVSRAVALLQQHAPDIEEESLAMSFGNTPRYATR